MERAPGLVLDLYRTRLGAQGATELASSLRGDTEWRQLRLSETNVGDVGATALAGALSGNNELETLDLAYNLIGDDGAITLASSLLTNHALTQLGLEGNHVGDAGLSALSAALASNGPLCVLDLRWNAIRGEAGVSAIAGALATNTVLEDLDLSCNEIGEAGVAAMADGLKENVGLRRLMLAGNDAGIGDACASAVVEALKCNSTLKELSLRFNRIGGDDLGDDAAAALRASAVLTEQSKKSLAAAYAVGTEERRMRERSEGWLRLERDRRIAELHAEAAAVIGEEIVAEIIFAEASHSISEHEEERRNEQLAAEAELAMLAAQTAAAKLNTAAPLSESIMRSLREASAPMVKQTLLSILKPKLDPAVELTGLEWSNAVPLLREMKLEDSHEADLKAWHLCVSSGDAGPIIRRLEAVLPSPPQPPQFQKTGVEEKPSCPALEQQALPKSEEEDVTAYRTADVSANADQDTGSRTETELPEGNDEKWSKEVSLEESTFPHLDFLAQDLREMQQSHVPTSPGRPGEANADSARSSSTSIDGTRTVLVEPLVESRSPDSLRMRSDVYLTVSKEGRSKTEGPSARQSQGFAMSAARVSSGPLVKRSMLALLKPKLEPSIDKLGLEWVDAMPLLAQLELEVTYEEDLKAWKHCLSSGNAGPILGKMQEVLQPMPLRADQSMQEVGEREADARDYVSMSSGALIALSKERRANRDRESTRQSQSMIAVSLL